MNKNEFLKITAEVVAEEVDDFAKRGASSHVLLAAGLTMSMIADKIADRIFVNEDDTLEIER